MRSIVDAALRHPLVRTRAMRQLTLANGLVGLSSAVFLPFLPLFLTTSVGASATEIGLLLSVSGFAVAFLLVAALLLASAALDEPGSASTLYFNALTAGSTVAGVLWGIVVAARGYRGAYAACVLLAAASIALLAAGHLVRRRPGLI